MRHKILVEIDCDVDSCDGCLCREMNGFGENRCALFDVDLEYRWELSPEVSRAAECLNAEEIMKDYLKARGEE